MNSHLNKSPDATVNTTQMRNVILQSPDMLVCMGYGMEEIESLPSMAFPGKIPAVSYVLLYTVCL